jgi:hypothetical protein
MSLGLRDMTDDQRPVGAVSMMKKGDTYYDIRVCYQDPPCDCVNVHHSSCIIRNPSYFEKRGGSTRTSN